MCGGVVVRYPDVDDGATLILGRTEKSGTGWQNISCVEARLRRPVIAEREGEGLLRRKWVPREVSGKDLGMYCRYARGG